MSIHGVMHTNSVERKRGANQSLHYMAKGTWTPELVHEAHVGLPEAVGPMLEWTVRSSDLNPTKHVRDELEHHRGPGTLALSH